MGVARGFRVNQGFGAALHVLFVYLSRAAAGDPFHTKKTAHRAVATAAAVLLERSGAVGSTFRRLWGWSRRRLLIIARDRFRTLLSGPPGSPPGFHRSGKFRATFR